MTDDGRADHGSRRPVPLRPLGALVDERVSGLQARYRNNRSSGVSDLAALRRASTAEPGADPRIWELTLAGIPTPAGAGDEPTAEERAAHAALTLYAVHQQSQSLPMHVPGQGSAGRCARWVSAPGPKPPSAAGSRRSARRSRLPNSCSTPAA